MDHCFIASDDGDEFEIVSRVWRERQQRRRERTGVQPYYERESELLKREREEREARGNDDGA